MQLVQISSEIKFLHLPDIFLDGIAERSHFERRSTRGERERSNKAINNKGKGRRARAASREERLERGPGTVFQA